MNGLFIYRIESPRTCNTTILTHGCEPVVFMDSAIGLTIPPHPHIVRRGVHKLLFETISVLLAIRQDHAGHGNDVGRL